MGQPRPLFCLFSFFRTENLLSSQRDSNSDRRSIRKGRWPLDHHHGPKRSSLNWKFLLVSRPFLPITNEMTCYHTNEYMKECLFIRQFFLKLSLRFWGASDKESLNKNIILGFWDELTCWRKILFPTVLLSGPTFAPHPPARWSGCRLSPLHHCSFWGSFSRVATVL